MDPGTEQKPSFFLGAGKLEWPFDFNRQEEVWLSTCWLAAQVSLSPSQKYLLSAREESGGKPA